MIVRGVDANHDWMFGKSKNDYKKDNLAVAQNIKTRLLSFLGDCFFQIDAGIDWFNLLGGKDLLAVEINISSTILNTAEVRGFVSDPIVSLDENRNLLIQYSVMTTYGTIDDQLIVGVQ